MTARKNERSGCLRISASASMSFALLSPLAQADALPDLSVFHEAVEVSDAALGEMRGRFVAAGQVLHFGVEMYSEWQTAPGDTHTAGLSFGLDTSGSAAGLRPTLNIASQGSASQAVDRGNAGNAALTSGDGIDKVDGIAQVNQIAGDLNRVNNALDIDIRPASEEASSRASVTRVPLARAGSFSFTDASGMTTHVQVDDRALGFALEIPGHGRVMQQLRGGNSDSGRGLLQRTYLTSDSNRITNLTHVVVEVSAGATAGANASRSAVEQLQALASAQAVR